MKWELASFISNSVDTRSHALIPRPMEKKELPWAIHTFLTLQILA
jgi:hypothetical protein